jgi:hypothetical protein
MKRLIVGAAVLAAALVLAAGAVAGIYAGPKEWSPGSGAGTSYSANWLRNYFSTYGSGFDKAVTFIDNQRYSWHNTVRNASQTTETYPPVNGTFKGHCVAYSWSFWGSCTIR